MHSIIKSKPEIETYKLIKKKPHQGLKLLYERYAILLLNYAINSWHISEDSAWDIVYKVLFKIIEKNNSYSFKSELQFKNMLYTFFNNALINFYHKNQRLAERLELIYFDEFLLSNSDPQVPNSIENEVNEKICKDYLAMMWESPTEENPVAAHLNVIIDELQDWERILIYQRAKGNSYKDIALFIDKPENQLKVYYSRLKQKIRTRLYRKIKEPEDE